MLHTYVRYTHSHCSQYTQQSKGARQWRTLNMAAHNDLIKI